MFVLFSLVTLLLKKAFKKAAWRGGGIAIIGGV